MKKVLLVGISNKEGKEPFDSSTASGRIVDQMIVRIPCEFFKINYVNFAPLDLEGKMRYPTKEELTNSFPSFCSRVKVIEPDLIVVFGKMIADELKKRGYCDYPILSLAHPSYIWVYRRNELDCYLEKAVFQIKDKLNL